MAEPQGYGSDERRPPHRARPTGSAGDPPPTLVSEVAWPPQPPPAQPSPRPPAAAWTPGQRRRPVVAAPPPVTTPPAPAYTPEVPPYLPQAPAYPPRAPPYPAAGSPPWGSPHHVPPAPAGPGAPAPAEVDHGFADGAAEAAEAVGRAAMASAGFVQTHTSRALSRNLRTVLPTEAEWPVLDARGVREMTVRQYLVWRRSWLYFIIPPAVVAAVIHLFWLFFDDTTHLSAVLNGFGLTVLVGTQLVQTLGFPVAAAVAVWLWDRHRLSRYVLTAGWVASFLLPFAVALIPFHHFVKPVNTEALLPGDARFEAAALVSERMVAGVVGGVVHLVTLLPAVLSMIPGVLRACVRIKSVLPESIVPGWFLVLASPMYALVLFLAFVAVNQVAGNLLLVVGVLLLMAAPAVYLWKMPLFIRPVAGQLERRQLVGIQGVYAGVVALGLLSLLLYVLTVKVLGRPLVGNDSPVVEEPHRAWLSVGTALWEAVKFVVGYTARSMYITAVAVDLFMLVNLSVWRNTKAFQRTPEAYAYDQIMADFAATAEAR